MTDREPIEPSAVLAADGTRVPRLPDPASALRSIGSRPLVPALVRAATRGGLRTASVLALAGVAAVKAAEMAGRLASHAPSMTTGGPGQHLVTTRLEISWTRIEIRGPL